jgi:hypothetical protein
MENVDCGLIDHLCTKRVAVVRRCGENLTLPCSEAFSKNKALGLCRNEVKAVNPNCGHPCTLPCHCIASIEMNSIPVPKSIVEEANLGTNGNILATSNLILAKRCTETIQLNRKCGHQERIECSKLQKPLKECKEMSTKLSPLCGHLLPLPCYVSSQLSFRIWS